MELMVESGHFRSADWPPRRNGEEVLSELPASRGSRSVNAGRRRDGNRAVWIASVPARQWRCGVVVLRTEVTGDGSSATGYPVTTAEHTRHPECASTYGEITSTNPPLRTASCQEAEDAIGSPSRGSRMVFTGTSLGSSLTASSK